MRLYILGLFVGLVLFFGMATAVLAETKLIETDVNVTFHNDNSTITLRVDTEDEDLYVDLTNITDYSTILNLDFLRELNCSYSYDSADFFAKFDNCYDMFNISWNCCVQFNECKENNAKLSTEIEKVYIPEKQRQTAEIDELKDKQQEKWLWAVVGVIIGVMGKAFFEKSKFPRPPEERLPRED